MVCQTMVVYVVFLSFNHYGPVVDINEIVQFVSTNDRQCFFCPRFYSNNWLSTGVVQLHFGIHTHTLTREEREKWKVHYKMKMICILNCSLLFFLCVSALLRLPVPFIFMLLYFVSDFIFLPHLPKIRSHNSFPLLLPCILDLGWHRPKNMYQISNN